MSNNEPGTTYSNPFTRMIERVQSAGGLVESPVTGSALPSVRTAAMNTPPPLTIEEREELDAKARELGLLGDEPEGEANPYPSLEAAISTGAPVESRVTAREFLASRSASFPRLPDFAQVGGIDLIRGVVYLDGMEFPIPEGDVAKYRLYVIEIAHADITRRLAEAMKLYAPAPAEVTEAPDGGTEAGKDVSEVS